MARVATEEGLGGIASGARAERRAGDRCGSAHRRRDEPSRSARDARGKSAWRRARASTVPRRTPPEKAREIVLRQIFCPETHNLNIFCQVRRSKFDWWICRQTYGYWGDSTVGRRARGHPRRLRSTDRHGLLRQRQRREGDRGESPPITRPRDPPRTRGNPRAAHGQFSLTVFQTGKPRRNFDRSWRGRGRRRRVDRVENAPTTPARRGHPARRRVRVVSPRARRSRGAALRSVGPNEPAVNNGAAGWL